VLFAPLVGWITQELGWRYSFFVMGLIGVLMWVLWGKLMFGPREHPGISPDERAYIERGGALMQMDGDTGPSGPGRKFDWNDLKQLLGSRMLLGIYIAQHCINVITYFFLTWFPIYLVKERGMSILNAGFVASLPALCGFAGGVLGGVISDILFRRTRSLTLARKVPIVGGMLLSMTIIACNYVDSPVLVVAVMALAFFGKGVGALGWAVVSDTSPKEIGGLSGGLFNMFGNTAGITTPIIIGYIIQSTGSFNGALVFVGINAFIAMSAYLFVVGDIHRVVLQKS
jgi:ACS family glucarate transporter-like MFS transporter